ncbi:hypothetical protein BDQ17DRAFT_1332352 [Cyathus striatus]|nr:hypothetical protein BDQ17DRAFT_1332352 [Cyathus striatus]
MFEAVSNQNLLSRRNFPGVAQKLSQHVHFGGSSQVEIAARFIFMESVPQMLMSYEHCILDTQIPRKREQLSFSPETDARATTAVLLIWHVGVTFVARNLAQHVPDIMIHTFLIVQAAVRFGGWHQTVDEDEKYHRRIGSRTSSYAQS